MNEKTIVKELLDSFAEKNRCSIYPMTHNNRPYFSLDAVPVEIRRGGPYSAGPTWMVFGVAGEETNRDLLVRAEMLIGEVDTSEGLAYAMRSHYINTFPVYAVCPIDGRLFLFMIYDKDVPLAVGQQSMEQRLYSELILQMLSDAIPGINVHPDVLRLAIQRHTPQFWDGLRDHEFLNIV